MADAFIYITNGQVQNYSALQKIIAFLDEGRYKITIERADKRSLPQNAWFHAILPEIVKGLRDVGYYEIRTTKDAKNFLKSMFFKKTVSNGTDEIEMIEDTSDTSKEDFTKRAEEIIIWAQTYLNLNIAPPNTQTEFGYR